MRRITTITVLLLCAANLAALTGCGKEVLVKVPVDRPVIVKEYKPLPPELLVLPKITYAKSRTVEEAVRGYNFNTANLEQCIIVMKKIIELQDYPAP